jgi:glycerol-3-phosphate dehydrogenase
MSKSTNNDTEEGERIEYLKTIKLVKKDNMTPLNCYTCQLSQIPGMSVETANIVAQQYGSMQKLILAYMKLVTSSDRDEMLSELIIPIANSKTRRLGNVLSKRIHEYLCDETTSTQVPSQQPSPSQPVIKNKITIKLKK